jgi:hypothetical protein
MVSEKNIAILKKKIPSGPMLKLYPTEGPYWQAQVSIKFEYSKFIYAKQLC